MKKILFFAFIFMLITSLSFAAGPKTYQVTGPVLELTPNLIVVQKGTEKWEIGRDASTKVNGDLKVGSNVTIKYTMKAATVDVKEAKKTDKKAEVKKK